jgi:hypothetical protein
MWFPYQFADRRSLIETVRSQLANGDLRLLVSDGSLDGRLIESGDLGDNGRIVPAVNDPSLVYAAMNRGNVILPIASFLTNQNLGSAKLHCLIDFNPLTHDRMLHKWTENALIGYLTIMFHQIEWLNRILVPVEFHESNLPFNVDRMESKQTVLIRR